MLSSEINRQVEGRLPYNGTRKLVQGRMLVTNWPPGSIVCNQLPTICHKQRYKGL